VAGRKERARLRKAAGAPHTQEQYRTPPGFGGRLTRMRRLLLMRRRTQEVANRKKRREQEDPAKRNLRPIDPQAASPAPPDTPAADHPPEKAPEPRRPVSTQKIPGGKMAGRIDAVVDTIQEQIAGFKPASREEFDTFMQRLGEIPATMKTSLMSMVDGWEGEHIHHNVKDQLREHAQAYGGLGDTADEAYLQHSHDHSLWLND
jgi:hypothetical protein